MNTDKAIPTIIIEEQTADYEILRKRVAELAHRYAEGDQDLEDMFPEGSQFRDEYIKRIRLYLDDNPVPIKPKIKRLVTGSGKIDSTGNPGTPINQKPVPEIPVQTVQLSAKISVGTREKANSCLSGKSNVFPIIPEITPENRILAVPVPPEEITGYEPTERQDEPEVPKK